MIQETTQERKIKVKVTKIEEVPHTDTIYTTSDGTRFNSADYLDDPNNTEMAAIYAKTAADLYEAQWVENEALKKVLNFREVPHGIDLHEWHNKDFRFAAIFTIPDENPFKTQNDLMAFRRIVPTFPGVLEVHMEAISQPGTYIAIAYAGTARDGHSNMTHGFIGSLAEFKATLDRYHTQIMELE